MPPSSNIRRRKRALMDPQQRLLLEVAWEAFEDAGQPVGTLGHADRRVHRIGRGGEQLSCRSAAIQRGPAGLHRRPPASRQRQGFLSTRVSYKLDLTGPSVNVQTACSTSLVAVHLACQAFSQANATWRWRAALPSACPTRRLYSVKGGILSPDGHCRAFDADAQGTVFGSGVGAVLLKRSRRCRRRRRHIYAVIRGSAINNDGG